MPASRNPFCPGGHVSRRGFLRVGSLGSVGIGISQYLRALSVTAGKPSPHRAQACILVWLHGGQSHVDSWDPKPNSGFKPISTNVDGIQISELLPGVAKHMDKLSIVRSMHTEENDHNEGTYYVHTGHSPNPAFKFPSFSSIIAKELTPRDNLPSYVVTSRGRLDCRMAGMIGPQYDPMVVPPPPAEGNYSIPDLVLPESITPEIIQDRKSFRKVVESLYRSHENWAEFATMDSYEQQALSMLLAPNVKDAFDLSQEKQKVRDNYGRDLVGQSFLLARRLVEAGCRFVTVEGNNTGTQWDTHYDNDRELKDDLMPPLDRTLSVLLEDLHQRGLLASTVVLVMGEFGRTPHRNPLFGRDHWCHCWSLALGGGGIQGGQIVGASDDIGAYVAERRVTQGDLFATIYKAFGIDWTKTYTGSDGRPLYIANSIGDTAGIPIKELV